MFFLKVERNSGHDAARILKANQKSFNGEKANAVIAEDEFYSFSYYEHPVLIVGEAPFSISNSEIKRVYNQIINKHEGRLSSNWIQTILIVNLDTGLIKFYKNVSCNRPLYFSYADSSFIASSHLHQLKSEGIRFEINQKRVPEFLVYRYVMPPDTLFKNIKAVPGGHSYSLDILSGQIQLRPLWDFRSKKSKVSIEEAAGNVSKLMRKSLQPLLDSTESSMVLLSGGLDSSVLGGFCRDVKLPVESISSGFHVITGDAGESEYAQSAADMLGIKHSIWDVGAEEYLKGLVQSIAAAEEPLHHLQSVVLGSLFSGNFDSRPGYFINGEGADLVFATGSHVNYWRARTLTGFLELQPLRAIFSRVFKALSNRSDKALYLKYYHGPDHSDENHFLWAIEAFGDMEWVKKTYGISAGPIIEGRSQLLDSISDYPLLEKMTVLLFCGDIDETMKIWGKLAEHNRYKVIYPFTYPDLVSYVMSLDWGLKTREPKYLLREVASRLHFLDEIIRRPKKSFGFPVRFWALPNTLFQPLVDMASEMYDKATLRELQSDNASRAMVLWGMISLFLLQKLSIDGVSKDDLTSEIFERRKTLKGKN